MRTMLREDTELERGRVIEQEHRPTYDMIARVLQDTKNLPSKEIFYESIAKDHLSEISDYYTRLDQMERSAKMSERFLHDEKLWLNTITQIMSSGPTKVWCDSLKKWFRIDKIYMATIPHQNTTGLYLSLGSMTWLLNPLYWISYDPNNGELQFQDDTYKFA